MNHTLYVQLLDLACGAFLLAGVLVLWRRDLAAIVRLFALQGAALGALVAVLGFHEGDPQVIGLAAGIGLLRAVLLPWLPRLITTLREHAAELVPALVREAGRTFPATLAAVDAWTPPWSERPVPAPGPAAAVAAGPVTGLLAAHPATYDAVADLLGYDRSAPPGAGTPGPYALFAAHPETAEAVAALLGGGVS